MTHATIEATNAIVTLDVAFSGIIWGWMITLNMWAKSIGTGVIFVGAYLLYTRHSDEIKGIKFFMPLLSFIFLNIFLLFTLLDLHQPLRMWHIFVYPHFTSAITVGAWMASVFTGIVSGLLVLGFIGGKDALYDKLLKAAVFLAIPVTMYTAVIMGQAAARELWQTPAELVQMMLAAILAGSAAFALISGAWSTKVRSVLAKALIGSAFLMFTMYMGEYFFSFKAEEAHATLAAVKIGGAYFYMFWIAMILAFVVPMCSAFASLKEDNQTKLKIAAVSALVGLWLAKHVWLVIPQLIPLS